MKTNDSLATRLCPQTMYGRLTSAIARRVLPLLLLLLTLPAAVQAQYNYRTKNGTITITGYTCSGGAVTIPSTINSLPVTSIGDEAFSYCTSLTSITIPNSVTSIGVGAFSACPSLTSITIPNSVTSIGDAAFQWCPRLTSVMIGNSVTSIGVHAFLGCTSLTSVTIPNSVTSIGVQAFTDCTSLSAITVEALNSGYSSVGGVLFNKNQTALILYPGSKAGSYTIPNSVTSIGGDAFHGCTRLSSVTIPKSVTSIGDDTFQGCTSLTSVTIPNNVTSIGFYAFSGCTSLTSVTIGNSVTSISERAFSGCTSLSAITVEALNSFYSSVDGVLFDKNQTTLIQYPRSKAGSFTIANSVTSFGSAFYGCTSLTSVTIPDRVSGIENQAFYGCTNLTGAYFTGDAPDFGNPPFEGDDKVVLYYLPGTTGWDSTFAGRPAVPWNPQALTSDASFGVRAGQFGFTITWASDKVIVVEACADLTNPVWTPVGTNTLTGGSSYFSDPEWTNYPNRVYRLRSQ